MNRRDFLKLGIGCVCLALLPPIPTLPSQKEFELGELSIFSLGELSNFSRDYGAQMVEDIIFENDIQVIAMKNALPIPPSDLIWREKN